MPRSVFAAMSLSAFIYFLAQMDRGFEILFARFEIRGFIACVAEQQRRLTVNQVPSGSLVRIQPGPLGAKSTTLQAPM